MTGLQVFALVCNLATIACAVLTVSIVVRMVGLWCRVRRKHARGEYRTVCKHCTAWLCTSCLASLPKALGATPFCLSCRDHVCRACAPEHARQRHEIYDHGRVVLPAIRLVLPPTTGARQ